MAAFSRYLVIILSSAVLAAAPLRVTALTPISDAGLEAITGTGLAFAWEDFRMLTDPRGFFEQVGSGVDPASGFQRGDMRWFGLSVSALGAGASFNDNGGSMSACASQGLNGLGCPRGGPIERFAAHDNPYILRAFDYAGDGGAANAIGNGIVTFTGDRDPASSRQTVLELLAPTEQDPFRFAFWGEIEVGKDPLSLSNSGLLKSQTLIQGNAANSILRLFQFTEPGNETLALLYHSHLQGDFRFSVAQSGADATDALGEPVTFDAQEGLHFLNVDAFIPLGQLFYQALTIDVPRDAGGAIIDDGNFVLELNRVPDNVAVFSRFYSLAVPDSPDAGFITARAALLSQTPGATPAVTVDANYFTTHGFARWGDWFPCRGIGCPNPSVTVPVQRNTYNASDDGIVFRKCSSCADFRAFSYRLTRVDVRANNNQFTNFQRMANFAGCTAGSSGQARFNCGYGGSFNASGNVVQNFSGQTDPMSFVTNSATAGPSTDVTLPMIETGVVNLGDSRIEGLLINHVKFTSYGAQF